MRVGYNEIDPYCCAWLENLMSAGLIPIGKIFCRDIRDIRPDEVAGFDQFHAFAGLGGWPYALELAGWDKPCWTGSCPCQPFSAAGKGLGFADERHLWPAFHWLIEQCRPAIVFGEQVARAGDWLALVRSDLEALDYAVGCMPIEAASVGANHLRDRMWFVADTSGVELRDQSGRRCWTNGTGASIARDHGATGAVADANDSRQLQPGRSVGTQRRRAGDSGTQYAAPNTHGQPLGWASEPWTQYRHWLVEPGMGRVVDGTPARVDKLRALGNAIVPQVAATFVRAFMEARNARRATG
jgi:DNA (cytosine-5)-methyltransferase 1